MATLPAWLIRKESHAQLSHFDHCLNRRDPLAVPHAGAPGAKKPLVRHTKGAETMNEPEERVCQLVEITWKASGKKERICRDTLNRFIFQYGRPVAFTCEEEEVRP